MILYCYFSGEYFFPVSRNLVVYLEEFIIFHSSLGIFVRSFKGNKVGAVVPKQSFHMLVEH